MQKRLFTLLFLSVFTFSNLKSQTIAQRSELSVGPEFVLPIGEFHKIADYGFGASAKYAFHIDANWAATLQTGITRFSVKDGSNSYHYYLGNNFSAIPIKIGGRYTYQKYYLEPQLGFVYFSNQEIFQNRSTIYGVNVGMYINKYLNTELRWERWNRGGIGASTVGLKVGYWFKFAKRTRTATHI